MLSISNLGLPCNNRLVKCEAIREPAGVKIVDGCLQRVEQCLGEYSTLILQGWKVKPSFSLPTPAEQPDNGYLGFKKAKEIVDFDVVCWAVTWERS